MGLKPTLDLEAALCLLDAARLLVRKYDGQNHSDDMKANIASTPASTTNKELMHAVHLLRRAAMEVENQYWVSRGLPDPLESP